MRFSLPFRFASCVAVASWFAVGGSGFAEKDWAYRGGPLPAASSAEKSVEPEQLPGASETFRQIASMAESLSASGWADPRGGEYRELTIPGEADRGENNYPTTFQINGSATSENKGQRKIRGWLLAKAGGNEQRYAVAWDGLVYPVIEIGPPADVDSDVKAALGEKKVTPFFGKVGLVPDRVSLAKVVLLIQLGMQADAAEMAKRWEEAAKAEDDTYRPDVYTLLATEWLAAQFDRALWAHCRGSYKLALAYLEPIPKARARVEADAPKFGAQMGRSREVPGWGKDLELSFLNQVPALISDEQRRVAEGVTSRPEIADPISVEDKAKRIALLVRDLEEVDAHPMMSKGYIDFPYDPVVKALVAQGEDAVDPLIEALANDPRLTRSVDGGRGGYQWQPGRSRVVGVEEPALAALVGILRSRDQLPNLDVPYVNYGPMPPKLKRAELARMVRAYWEKYRGKPLVERWHGLLADDAALPGAWAEAAENLTLKESQGVPVYGEMNFEREPKPGQPDPMRGEVLRDKVKPSISELMAKRLKEAFAWGKESGESFSMHPAKRLASALAKWDGAKEREMLRWYSQELEKLVAEKKDGWERESMEELIRTYVARKKAGDETALADYAKWVLAQDARKYSSSGYGLFAPLWVYPGDPALAGVAERLFLDPASSWRQGVNRDWITRGAETPLVGVPEYRALVLEQLDNPLVIGRVELKPDERGTSPITYLTYPPTDDANEAPKREPAPMQDLRMCDQIADKLTRVRGVPEFSPHWPMEKRDKAIAGISAFVRKYGGRWAAKAQYPWDDVTSREAELRFPRLGRPATQEDVAKGNAIFSMDGATDRRVWPLPEIPRHLPPPPEPRTKAHWLTLHDSPRPALDGSIAYDQEVDVWQAEDAIVDGQWKRMFGVVGKNRVAAVPGDEIEFNAGTAKSDGWQLGLSLEGNVPAEGELPVVRPEAPVIVNLALQNSRGMPRSFVRKDGIPETSPAKALGMDLRLTYFPGSFETFRNAGPNQKWETVAARADAQVEFIPNLPAVETLKRADFARFDLARAFDLSAPGVYRVFLSFEKGGLFEEGKSVSWGWMFEVKK